MPQQPLGITTIVQSGQDATGVYQSSAGGDAFITDEPYALSDETSLARPLPVNIVSGPTFTDIMGNEQTALALNIASPPNPPVPGPLDYVENGENLSNITVSYDLARPVAMLGIAFRHTGHVTTLTATHGGEPLTLVSFILNPLDNIGVATFIGNGLMVEPANLVITPVGGTIGPAVLRIDDSFAIDAVEVGYAGTEAGYGDQANLSPLIKFEPVSGQGWGVWALAGASGEKQAEIVSRGAGQVQTLFWGIGSSGTLAEPPSWQTVGAGWVQNGAWWEHTGAVSYLTGTPLPQPMPNPFWWEIEIDVAAGDRLYVQTIGAGGGYLSETFIGPVSGVFRRYRSQSYSASRFRIQALGNAKFRNFKYCDNGSTIYGTFGRTVAQVPNGSGIQFRMGALSRYAGAAMEVHEG